MVGLKIRLDEPVFSHNGEMCSVFSHQAAADSIFKKKVYVARSRAGC